MTTDQTDFGIHDQVVVETELPGSTAQVMRLDSFVTNVLPEELWLASHVPDSRIAELEPGQALNLTFTRGEEMTVESEFVRRIGDPSKLGMEKSRLFSVRRPKDVAQVQPRAHVRVDLQRSVRIRSLVPGLDSVGSGRTVDIGAGGIQFATEMPLLLGEQLRLALVLTSKDIIITNATVVRIEASPDAEAKSLVAARFDKITELDQERITCHILAERRQHKTPIADKG